MPTYEYELYAHAIVRVDTDNREDGRITVVDNQANYELIVELITDGKLVSETPKEPETEGAR